MKPAIAIQLYTVRDCMAKDFEGTIKKLAAVGYRNFEFAGLFDRKPQEVRKFLDGLGVKAICAHVGLDGTEDNIKKHAEDAHILGYQYIVTSGFPGYQWGKPVSSNQWTQGVHALAKVGQWATKHGITFCYHNHSFEFVKLDNSQRPMDMLFEQAQPPLSAELDVYWVTHGHDDPLVWMNKLAGRVPLLHIKDMDKTEKRGFAEVGTGIVKIKDVVAQAPKVGAKYLIVEQDSAWIDGDSVKSATVSYQNLCKILG